MSCQVTPAAPASRITKLATTPPTTALFRRANLRS
jgi:hypothetical protein